MAPHKEFNRDEALQDAMEVFWSRGYPDIQGRRISFGSRVKKVEPRKAARTYEKSALRWQAEAILLTYTSR